MQTETLPDVLQTVADQQIALFGQLGQMTGKIAPFLLLERFQVLGFPCAPLIDHELSQRSKVPDHTKAVILEVSRDTLEVRVPLFL